MLISSKPLAISVSVVLVTMRSSVFFGINFNSRGKIGCPLKKVLLFILECFNCRNSKLPIYGGRFNLLFYKRNTFTRQ
jgi:hypothetical protein